MGNNNFIQKPHKIMPPNLRILILEDNLNDADLLNRELKRSGLSFTSEIVQTCTEFEHALQHFNPDLILSDYSLPSFNAVTAFRIKQNKLPNIPFIIVSGVIGEENAVDLIKTGVTDYASKDKLFTLSPKINRALKDSEEWKEKQINAEKLKIQAAALIVANKELVFQNEEKEKRAEELGIANKELAFQNEEKEKRAAELIIANKLAYQNEEKEKRAAELIIANNELANYKYALDESSIVGITDEKGIIIYANDNFCKISKYSLEELIGQDHKIISSGYHSKEYIRNLWLTIAQGKTWKGELKNKAKDGTNYWVDTTITPFLNEQGKPYQYVATRFDITERKKAELNLEKQNKELLKTNKELDRFVYSVSHDLRSPLTSIQGLVSIIEDESKEPETLEHVQMIKSSINRLDEFVRKILSYSQNNRTELEVEIIPLKKTILNIVHFLENMPQAKGIHFEIDIQEQSSFYTDKLRFNTILENLISNAIKYHKPIDSERFIKVTGNADGEMLQLKISDNGIGIASQYQDKIFDMFFRISSKSEGSGIGLYIVKDTVEKLEGSIHILSQINAGTTFVITLKNFTP